MVGRIAKGGLMLALLAGVTLITHLAIAGAADGPASSASAVDLSNEVQWAGIGVISTSGSCPACLDFAGGCANKPAGYHCGSTQFCWCKWCGGQFKCMRCTAGEQMGGYTCTGGGGPIDPPIYVE